MYGIIYRAICISNGKKYYGKTINLLENRKQQHLNGAQAGDQQHSHFYNAIRKHGPDDFIWEVVEECANKDSLNECEKRWIAVDKTIDREFGYNMTEGGTGGPPSEEVKKRISASLMGHVSEKRGTSLSDETKKRISETLIGRPSMQKGIKRSKEVCQRISEARKGIKPDPKFKETRMQISKKIWENYTSEERERRIQKAKDGLNRPEVRVQMAEASRKNQQNPEVKERQRKSVKEALSRPETKKRMCEAQKEVQNRPEVIARKSEAQREIRNRPEMRIHMSKVISGKRWIYDPNTLQRKRIDISDIERYLALGCWRLGRGESQSKRT